MIREMNGARSIYLDNAATTRPTRLVIDRMAEAQYECFGNPSSSHTFGPPAKHALDDARDFLRGTVAAGSIVFTLITLVIRGILITQKYNKEILPIFIILFAGFLHSAEQKIYRVPIQGVIDLGLPAFV
ncbi:MAG TPA: aminotransferase class V-fold PLP-dependent enzyme, partial [Planctomycetes bacterium]|nr:aminotransferase class V-fold PLP-dependent enzyme [Planctomycetota bacterium]